MPAWRKNKTMKLTNRGLTTTITMMWLLETESYRITRIIQITGGVPATTLDKIYDPTEAVELFAHLCIEAIDQEYTHPQLPVSKVFDLTDADEA